MNKKSKQYSKSKSLWLGLALGIFTLWLWQNISLWFRLDLLGEWRPLVYALVATIMVLEVVVVLLSFKISKLKMRLTELKNDYDGKNCSNVVGVKNVSKQH